MRPGTPTWHYINRRSYRTKSRRVPFLSHFASQALKAFTQASPAASFSACDSAKTGAVKKNSASVKTHIRNSSLDLRIFFHSIIRLISIKSKRNQGQPTVGDPRLSRRLSTELYLLHRNLLACETRTFCPSVGGVSATRASKGLTA